jgi:hypothetical protein
MGACGLALEAAPEAYADHAGKALDSSKRAVDSALRMGKKEKAAAYLAIAAQQQAVYSNPAGARRSAAEALQLVPTSKRVQSNNLSCLYPLYVRGNAYLAAGQGAAAAIEFQKIMDHRGIVWDCWTGPLAHLGVARTNALESRIFPPFNVGSPSSVQYPQKKNLPTSWTARPGCGSVLTSAVVEPVTEVITPKNPAPSV